MDIAVSLDSSEVQRNIRRLTDREVGRAMASAINKTMFDMLDAEKLHVASRFNFAGPQTQRFLSGPGSFRFDRATPTTLLATLYPRKRTEAVLEEHQRGAMLMATEGDRLRLGELLAVPLKAAKLRGPTGRVAKRKLPSEVLSERGRGFLAGHSIRERTGGKRRGAKRRSGRPSETEALYALVPSARVEPRFEFYRVARDVARMVWSKKARRAFEKIRFG